MAAKVLVNSENTVSVSCPHCKKSKDIDASKFRGSRDATIKCPWGNTWRVVVEYRRGVGKKQISSAPAPLLRTIYHTYGTLNYGSI